MSAKVAAILEKLTIEQKAELFPAPAWHQEVLEERLRLAQSGAMKFYSIDETMAAVRRETGL